MKSILFALALFSVAPAFGRQRMCDKYANNAPYVKALNIVATNLQYTLDGMCNLSRLSDIYVDRRNWPSAKDPMKMEMHIWVTLHYNEYSCQYFVRESDGVVTRKNCYNTF